MMTKIRLLSAGLALVLTAGCAETPLPPEAYGLFEERNDPIFEKRLNVTNDRMSLVLVSVLGRAGNPLTCQGGLPDGPERSFELVLRCAGEEIPHSFEWRDSTGDWVIREEGGDPMIFTRR